MLFDPPGNVAGAGQVLDDAGVRLRIQIVAGDFFEVVPPGPHGYVLKRTSMTGTTPARGGFWQQVHAAAAPGTRLFVLDAVIEHGNAPDFAKLLDLQMLVFTSVGASARVPSGRRCSPPRASCSSA